MAAPNPGGGGPGEEKTVTVPFTPDASAVAAVAAVDEAIRAYREEVAVAAEAKETAAGLAHGATLAAITIAAAKKEIDTIARGAYMMGGPTFTQLFIQSDGADISQVIRGLQYAEHITMSAGKEPVTDLDTATHTRDQYLNALNTWWAADDAAATAATRIAETSASNAVNGPEFTAITSLDRNGCPTIAPTNAIENIDPAELNNACQTAINQPGITPDARNAIQWAFTRLGAPYACDGVGRENVWQFDCSSYVARAYADGAGIDTHTNGWPQSTHTMLANEHDYAPIEPDKIQPGDLALYDTCPEGETCAYNHVVLYLGNINGTPMQLHTNTCGTPAKLTPFWGTVDSDKGKYLKTVRPVRQP
jgi:cell wall-associated NlpC family hydrolase